MIDQATRSPLYFLLSKKVLISEKSIIIVELSYEFLETPCFSVKVQRVSAVYSRIEEDGLIKYKLVHGSVRILEVLESQNLVEMRRKVA